MTEFITARNGGFCQGVKKAVDTALSVPTENAYIYGEIIHNKGVNDEIQKRGLKTVESLEEVPNGATLIIRSHGVGESVYAECKNRDIQIIDCTCGFVKRTQNIKYLFGKPIIIKGGYFL